MFKSGVCIEGFRFVGGGESPAAGTGFGIVRPASNEIRWAACLIGTAGKVYLQPNENE
jgi:hypothetical protein